jgi:DnaJ-class molecular chaperone
MSSGHSIVFEQEGDEPEEYAPNKKRGDVVFTIEEKPHQLFLRHGNHLFMKHKLSLTEALRGQFQIPHLDGRILNVVSKSPLMSTSAGLKSRPASLLKYIPNAGMPIFCENKKHIEQYGNLYVQLCVDYPSTSSMTHGVSDLSKLLPTKLISETVEEAPQGEPLYLLDVNVNDVDLPASWRQA